MSSDFHSQNIFQPSQTKKVSAANNCSFANVLITLGRFCVYMRINYSLLVDFLRMENDVTTIYFIKISKNYFQNDLRFAAVPRLPVCEAAVPLI